MRRILFAVLLALPVFGQTVLQSVYDPRNYAFTRTNGGGATSNLGSTGAKTALLAPCPSGISAVSVNVAYVYISGGVGTAEAVKITSFTSNGNTCTIGFTTANTHSGSFVISSASGGIQEAFNAMPSGNGTVALYPSATISAHAKITFPIGRNTLDGQNFFNYGIIRASDYPNGDLLYEPDGAITTIKNMWIGNGTIATQTSGAGIAYAPGTDADLSKVNVLGGWIGYDFNGTSTIDWEMCGFNSAGQTNRAAVWIHDTTGTHTPVNSTINGGNFSLTAGTFGFLVQSVDGLQINNFKFGYGLIQIYISLGSVAGNYVASIIGTNLFMDNATQSAVKVDGPAGIMTNLRFYDSSFQGDGNGLNGYGLDICYSNSCASGMYNWVVSNSNIQGWGKSGIAVGATATHGIVDGNMINDNNQNNASDGGIRLDVATSYLSITANRISNYFTGLSAGHQEWAIGFVNGGSHIAVTGNDLSGNISSALSISGAITNSTIESNNGSPIPVFANNGAAVAGGLWVGAKYRTGADPDVVCTVH